MSNAVVLLVAKVVVFEVSVSNTVLVKNSVDVPNVVVYVVSNTVLVDFEVSLFVSIVVSRLVLVATIVVVSNTVEVPNVVIYVVVVLNTLVVDLFVEVKKSVVLFVSIVVERVVSVP